MFKINRFDIIIVVRLIVLAASVFLLAYLILVNQLFYSIITLSAIILVQVFALIHFIHNPERHISLFLEHLKQNDISISFAKNNKIPDDLRRYFTQIIEVIRHVRIEKETQFKYLQYVIEHLNMAVLSFDENGKIELINHVAKTMFNMATISNIRNLDLIHENFSRILFNLQPSDNKVIVVKVLNNDNRLAGKEILLHLSIKASELRINDRHIKLVSLQNIKPELDAKELDSWQKLIRVLTHEIMNTITPITSLSSAIAVLFQHNNKVKPVSELDDELIVETVEALNLIEERGKTLISFVDKYRRLSRLPQPIFKPVSIAELVQTAYMLMASELKQRNITTSMEIAEADMNVNVDAGQINQVLINLIKNSMEALANTTEPRITIRAVVDNDNRSLVQVIDNGKGISDEIMDAIFIPFFTTKEEGSGIGLSLSRQIMRLHGGTITANSIPHRETVFTLIF